MQKLIFIAYCFILFSCSTSKEKKIRNYGNFLDIILNEHNVKGTILIYNSANKTYNSNSFYKANMGYLPAETFIIPHTLIALETNIMDIKRTNSSTLKSVKFDLTKEYNLESAFKTSFTPYYQEISKRIGFSKMNYYLNKFHYPKMIISEYTLDNFWFFGPSKITPFEQIDFLEKIQTNKLSIKKNSAQKLLQLMLIKETHAYKIYGKESWTDYLNNSWFVGFIIKHDKIYYFATNLEPKNPHGPLKSYIRSQDITLEALRVMNIL